MRSRRMQIVLVATLLLAPGAAEAQASGVRERELAVIIQQAGYDCPAVQSIEVAPSLQPGLDFRPEVALCRNGHKYLVARSGRSGGNVPPTVRLLSAPARN